MIAPMRAPRQAIRGALATVRTLFSDAASRTKIRDAARGSILTQTPLDYPLLEGLFLSGHSHLPCCS
jgi:hypothetical protein